MYTVGEVSIVGEVYSIDAVYSIDVVYTKGAVPGDRCPALHRLHATHNLTMHCSIWVVKSDLRDMHTLQCDICTVQI